MPQMDEASLHVLLRTIYEVYRYYNGERNDIMLIRVGRGIDYGLNGNLKQVIKFVHR